MKSCFYSFRDLQIWASAIGVGLFIGSAAAQNTNLAELRELRISCLDSFSMAQSRLQDLHAFVGQQSMHERGAADQLYRLKGNADSVKRRTIQLSRQVLAYSNQLDQAKAAVDRATVSYRTAVETLPTGENWATEGSAALNELRRVADAATRDDWKHKRFKEVEAEFVATLGEWRSARRAIEQANFDLEMRAAPGVFKRVGDQIARASGELKQLDTQRSELETTLAEQTKRSEQWGAAIRKLNEGEAKSQKQLAEIRSKFHLVDLKFAAWRLQHSADKEIGLEALPDVLEKSMNSFESVLTAGMAGESPFDSGKAENSILSGPHDEDRTVVEGDEQEQPDPAFAEILARVNLAQSRLSFIAKTWNNEVGSVRSTIEHLENLQETVSNLENEVTGLAANQASLRRSLETENRSLSTGEETLGLVEKRFAADMSRINDLLQTAEEKTAKLSKNLEK